MSKKKNGAKQEKQVRIPTGDDIKGGGAKDILLNSMPFFVKMTGLMVRTIGKTPGGPAILRAMSRGNAAMIVSMKLFNVEKAEAPADVVSEWLKMLRGVNCEFEVGKVTDGEVEVFLLGCPLGLTPEHGREMCITAMETDSECVKRLGGKLIIGETIATGAGKCHLRVVRPE